MKVQVTEMWVAGRALVMKVEIWGADGSWRQKRYSSVEIEDIPLEVLEQLMRQAGDLVPEEDHHQTALF